MITLGKRTRGTRKDREDYSVLLESMQKEKADLEQGVLSQTKPKPEPMPYTPSPERQRMLSNQNIQYALVTRGSGFYIHDKSCPSLKSVPDFAITWLEDYDPQAFRCTLCEFKAYLRLGAKDPGRSRDYEKLYHDFRFHTGILHNIYVENNMRTELIGSDTLKIWGKEDTWLIKRVPSTERDLELYHNNYKSRRDGTRKFIPGYHLQYVGNSRKRILDIVASYTYDGHKSAMKRKQVFSSPQEVPPEISRSSDPVHIPSLLSRLFAWLKSLFHS